MRTRAVARCEGSRKVVSERLNCRASACMVAVSSPMPSSNTHSGLPLKDRLSRVKTLSSR